MVHSYFFGSTGQRFIYHMSVERGRMKYNRAETKQSRAEHSHPVVGWFLGLAPEHLCRLGSQPVRGAYTNLIYMCRTSLQLSSLTCPSAPSPRGPLASAEERRGRGRAYVRPARRHEAKDRQGPHVRRRRRGDQGPAQ